MQGLALGRTAAAHHVAGCLRPVLAQFPPDCSPTAGHLPPILT